MLSIFLRYFNVVGADYKLRTGEIAGGSLFGNICASIKAKKKILIFGKNYKTTDGTCIRDYIDINDLSILHIISHKYISNKKKSIIINCGYSKPLTVMNILKNFEIVLNKKILKKFVGKRAGDVEKIYSNNTLLKKIFPEFKKKFSLKKSVLNTLKWEKILK